MSRIKKAILIPLFIISVCFIVYFIQKEKIHLSIDYERQYEKEIINYFKQIALQSEFDDNPQKVIKWVEPMILFVRKEGELKPQIQEIKKTISEINKLATDGFKITLTDDISKSNSVLFLCDMNMLSKYAPYFYEIVTNNMDYEISGYAYSEYITKTHIIDKALIFINLEESFDIQQSTIREEITQSLGLAYDSKKYDNSIFYEDKYDQKTRVKEYSELDKDIIQLLYNPKVRPGLDSDELESVVTEIFKSEK